MRLLLATLSAVFISGCMMVDVPTHSFTPTVKADGEKGWRIVYRNYPPDLLDEILSQEIGKNKICPNGWVKTPDQIIGGWNVIDGKCK